MITVLGISAFYHDSAAAIIRGGEVIAAAQEERFSRLKHDAGFPAKAIEYCLDAADVSIDDVDFVVFYEKPFTKLERILETFLTFSPSGYPAFRKAIPLWLKDKLFQSHAIRKGLGAPQRRLLFVSHHQSHAASAFFASPFEEAAILTADGVGEWATTTLGTGNRNRLKQQHELRFPDSLGLLYSAFTAFCGFRVNGGEGKLMGLAPFGEPKYESLIADELVDIKLDGSIRLNPKYFSWVHPTSITNRHFRNLFQTSPRVPESEIRQIDKDLAASIQRITERALLNTANFLAEQTGQTKLCVAGGVALNCVANGRLLRESPFENIWVQPAAGDAGGALGAALFVAHQLLDQRRFSLDGQNQSYALGPTLQYRSAGDRETIEDQLDRLGVHSSRLESDVLTDTVARRLADRQVIGWIEGRMEFGPRALGHRSLLAHPGQAAMQDEVNLRKRREPFRPFAPILRNARVSDYYQLNQASPYMLLAAPLKPSVVDPPFPAVIHRDRTSRVQTVTSDQHPRLHELLVKFENQTGCPALLNTSFNRRGQPLVSQVEDALEAMLEMPLDAIVIDDYLIVRDQQDAELPERLNQRQKSLEAQREPLTHFQRGMKLWLTITFPIRWTVSESALVLLFFGVFTPIGWLLRRKQNTLKAIDKTATSYWIPSESIEDESLERYFKQY